jgi:hypothetical protein
MTRYAVPRLALFILVWINGCSITGGSDQPTPTSTSISNPAALTKGSPVYQVSDTGDMELVRYFNDLGEEISLTVDGIAKAGDNWVILHTSLEITLLVNVETGEAFDISGRVNPDFLYGVERNNYIYFGNADLSASGKARRANTIPKLLVLTPPLLGTFPTHCILIIVPILAADATNC